MMRNLVCPWSPFWIMSSDRPYCIRYHYHLKENWRKLKNCVVTTMTAHGLHYSVVTMGAMVWGGGGGSAAPNSHTSNYNWIPRCFTWVLDVSNTDKQIPHIRIPKSIFTSKLWINKIWNLVTSICMEYRRVGRNYVTQYIQGIMQMVIISIIQVKCNCSTLP